MLTPIKSPNKTLPRRSPHHHVHPKTPLQEPPRPPITPRRQRSTSTRRSCFKGSLVMARLLLVFCMSVACILMFSRTLLPEASYFEVVPIEMQQGLPTSPSKLLYEKKERRLNSTIAGWPRVVLLEESTNINSNTMMTRKVMRMRSTFNRTVSKRRFVLKFRRPFLNQCTLMHDWQSRFYPTCNSLHELDLVHNDDDSILDNTNSSNIELLSGRGSWRMAWKVSKENITVALKMLHTHREFDEESFGHSTVDAIVMERLTKSKHTVNSFGFCGQSVITEWAPGTARDLIKHPKLDTLHRLMLARDLALGLSDVHSIGSTSSSRSKPTFAHNDINVANMVQTMDGRIKYNDFNIGVMMRWNNTGNRPCGFPVEFASPLWRAPEEISNTTYVSEKVDVYSLGNVIFQILTKHQPWSWLEPEGRPSLKEVGRRKAKGELPYLPEKHRNNTRLEIQALQCAYKACYTFDPQQRPSAKQLSEALTQVLRWKKQKKKVQQYEIQQLFGLI